MSLKDTIHMSKEEAIYYVNDVFKGNDTFVSQCVTMIASTSDFKGILNHNVQVDTYDWEKLLSLTISFGKHGFKLIRYRKGNSKNHPIGKPSQKANIHDYEIINYENDEAEEFSWDVSQ